MWLMWLIIWLIIMYYIFNACLKQEKKIKNEDYNYYTQKNWEDYQQNKECLAYTKIKKEIKQNKEYPKYINTNEINYYDNFYPKEWNNNLKKSIKKRDGYKCMNPDCWEEDNILTVHHINFNKKNCTKENLITVCRSCNSRANRNRNQHELWYKTILHEKYGYEYKYEKNITTKIENHILDTLNFTINIEDEDYNKLEIIAEENNIIIEQLKIFAEKNNITIEQLISISLFEKFIKDKDI